MPVGFKNIDTLKVYRNPYVSIDVYLDVKKTYTNLDTLSFTD